MNKSKTKDPDIEINAKINGTEQWKDWGKSWEKNKSVNSSHGAAGAAGGLYFFGFVGALIYYMQAASNFGAVIIGILKASIWPSIIVYKLLESFYGIVR